MSQSRLEAIAAKLGMSVARQVDRSLENRVAEACGDNCRSAKPILERRSGEQRFVLAEVSLRLDGPTSSHRSRARSIERTGETARVLYDPLHASRLLFIEELVRP